MTDLCRSYKFEVKWASFSESIDHEDGLLTLHLARDLSDDKLDMAYRLEYLDICASV